MIHDQLHLKARYVDAYNLRGLMFWALAGDDSMGTLVNTIYNENMPDIKLLGSEEKNNLINIKIIQPSSSDKFVQGSDIIIKTKTDNLMKVRLLKLNFLLIINQSAITDSRPLIGLGLMHHLGII